MSCSFFRLLPLISIAVVLSSVTTLAALPPREVTLQPAVGQLEQIVQVVAPGARTAAVSEVAGVLVLAHKPGVEPQVSLWKLDDSGQVPAAATASIMLPKPAAVGPRVNYPLALAVHPTLPLLYVWQDLVAAKGKEPADNLADDGFCHLLIYDLTSAQPKLVQSLARGDDYARSNLAGAIVVDATRKRLFVPNLRSPTTTGTFSPAIGYVRLEDSGLSADAEEATLEMSTSAGKKSSNAQVKGLAAAERKAYLAGIRNALTPVMPGRAARAATAASATFGNYPAGVSFLPVSETVTIVGGALGPVTWDEANRRAQFNCVTLHPVVGVGYQWRLAGHTTLPLVAVAGMTSGWLHRLEHVDGFFTMLPQRANVVGAKFASPPVMISQRRQVACGGVNAVHFIGLDEAGYFTAERTDVAVKNPLVEAIAYSPCFDRLYVAVEKVR